MKKIILILIITLVLAVLAFFSISYFAKDTGEGEDTGPVSEGINFLAQFNPFRSDPGKEDEANPPFIDENPSIEQNPEVIDVEIKLKKVSSMPVAGYTSFLKERFKEIPVVETPGPTTPPAETGVTTPTPTTPAKTVTKKPAPAPTEFVESLRYVERATGNIYQTFVDKIEEIKFSSTVIPKIYDAYFGNSGESVVMRHLKPDGRTIETFLGQLPKEKLGADGEIIETKGTFLADNIQDISLSPDRTKIFYTTPGVDSIVGTVLTLRDAKKAQIFDSNFTEWLSFWGSSKTVSLTTKPSGFVPGHMYNLDVDKKTSSKVFGGINGLTTLPSPNGKIILYSDNNMLLNTYSVETKASTSLGIRTLVDKCVWNKISEVIYCAVPKIVPGVVYPDTWYQGEVSFTDQIWKINLKGGNTTILVDPLAVLGGEEVDGIKLTLSTYEDYLFFVNKKDSFLWELNLK